MITGDVYLHLPPGSEIKSMKKLEETFFSELCSLCSKLGWKAKKEQ